MICMDGKEIRLSILDNVTGEENPVNPPDSQLNDIPFMSMNNITCNADAKWLCHKQIPKKAGCYWISTDEPCHHTFNGQHSPLVKTFDNRHIVYNGVTTDLQKRFKDHLLRDDSAGGFGSMSGISIDILDFCEGHVSKPHTHVKHAYTPNKKKLPKVLTNNGYETIDCKEKLLRCCGNSFTFYEKRIISKNDTSYFKNGINVCDRKHQKWTWVYHFIPIDDDFVRSYIEIKWREYNGVPPLASYISGR